MNEFPNRYRTPQAQDSPPEPIQRNPRRKQRRQGRLSIPRLLVVILCIGVILYAGYQLIAYIIGSITTQVDNARLQQIHASVTPAPALEPTHTPQPTATPAPRLAATSAPTRTPAPTLRTDFQFVGQTTRPEMAELWKINHDLIGWVNIPGVVDLPVVYKDNEYYLKRDFYKKRSNAGTLFLDVNHPLRPENQYLVLHGHNMKDGTMFGLLSRYTDREYARKHPTVYWKTLYREEVYKIFAVLVVPTDYKDSHFVPYLGTPKFSSVAHFNSFIDQIRRNARYITSEKVTHDDALLTLSTCLDEDRIVILCKRTSPQ